MTRREATSAGTGARGSGRLLAGACTLVAGLASLSPARALPIQKGTMTTIEAQGDLVQGYLVRPVAAGFHPGVVLVHEWWGLTEQIKGVADRLAGEGFVVIAPDLYRGKVASDAGWARTMSRGLDEDRAVEVIGAAADLLRGRESRYARRLQGQKMPVAAFGIGMGGRLSLAAALRGKDLQAAIMFYGGVEPDGTALRDLRVPLLGIFGDEDREVPSDQVRAFETALKAGGKDATILIYRSVGTAFFNEERPGYQKEAAKMAWERTLEFLRDRLGSPGSARPQGEPGMPPAEARQLPD